MRRIKNVIILMMFMLWPFMIVNAACSLSLTCPDKVAVGEQFKCVITGETDETVTGLSAKIKIDGGISFTEKDYLKVDKSYWFGNDDSTSLNLVATGDKLSCNGDSCKIKFNVGTITLVMKDDSNNKITISNAQYSKGAPDYDIGNITADLSKKVEIKMVDNTPSEGNVTDNKDDGGTGEAKKEEKKNTDNKKESTNDSGSNTSDGEGKKENITENEKTVRNITIYGYDGFKFDPDIHEYTLEIAEDETKLLFDIAFGEEFESEIKGNNNLVNGSKIEIYLSDRYNNVYNYIINIKKLDKKEKVINYSYIFIAIIAILVIVNIVRIIVSQRKRKLNSK